MTDSVEKIYKKNNILEMTKLEGKQDWISTTNIWRDIKHEKEETLKSRGRKRQKRGWEKMANIEKRKRRPKILIIGISNEGKQRNRKIMRTIIKGYFDGVK